jgi:hypothetical protein
MLQNLGMLDLWEVVGFFTGLAIFFNGFRIYREYRLLADTPEIPIRSIPMGLVHICGKARGVEAVPSPVTHAPCYFYKVEIEKWKTSINDQSGKWVLDRTDTGGVKFFLEDASGKDLVDAREAEYDLEASGERETGPGAWQGPGATEEELLHYINSVTVKKTESAEERAIASRLSIVENRLRQMGPQSDPEKEKKRLEVLEAFKYPAGSAEFVEHLRRISEVDPKPEETRNLVALIQAVKQPLQFSPESTNSPPSEESTNSLPSERYHLTEYCILPEHEYNIIGTCVENPEAKDEHERNLMMKGLNEPTFLISWRSEKGIESGLRRRAVYQVFGGAALAIACLGIFLMRIRLL